jgi:hypothetical protein
MSRRAKSQPLPSEPNEVNSAVTYAGRDKFCTVALFLSASSAVQISLKSAQIAEFRSLGADSRVEVDIDPYQAFVLCGLPPLKLFRIAAIFRKIARAASPFLYFRFVQHA